MNTLFVKSELNKMKLPALHHVAIFEAYSKYIHALEEDKTDRTKAGRYNRLAKACEVAGVDPLTLCMKLVEPIKHPVNQPTEPAILSANTYRRRPEVTFARRRASEGKHQQEVASFFAAIGLQVERIGNNVVASGRGLEVTFNYSESASSVYKHLAVSTNGKPSNIKALRKLYTCSK